MKISQLVVLFVIGASSSLHGLSLQQVADKLGLAPLVSTFEKAVSIAICPRCSKKLLKELVSKNEYSFGPEIPMNDFNSFATFLEDYIFRMDESTLSPFWETPAADYLQLPKNENLKKFYDIRTTYLQENSHHTNTVSLVFFTTSIPSHVIASPDMKAYCLVSVHDHGTYKTALTTYLGFSTEFNGWTVYRWLRVSHPQIYRLEGSN